jgi:hypothetical protein
MSPTVRLVVRIVAIVFVLMVMLIVALPWIVSLDSVRARVIQAAESVLHRKVEAGAIRLEIFSGLGAGVERVAVRNREGWESASPFLSVEHVSVKVAFWPLLSRRVELRRVVLDRATVTIERAPQGALNIDDFMSASGQGSPGASQAMAAAFLVSRIEIARGRLLFVDRRAVPAETVTVALEDLTGRITDIGPSTAARFELAARFLADTGRNLTLRGAFGPPLQGRPLAAAPFRVGLAAKNLVLARIRPYLGVSLEADPGVLSIDATAEGVPLGTSGLAGSLKLAPAGASSPVPAIDGQFAMTLDWPNGSLVIEKAPFSVAKLPITIEGRVDDLRASRRVDVRIGTPGDVPIDSVTGLPGIAGTLPAGVRLSGRVRLAAEIQGPAADLAARGSLEAAPLGVTVGGRPFLAAASAKATLASQGKGPLAGRVTAPAGRLKNLPFEDLAADWSYDKGALTLAPSARVYGGTLRARVESDFAHPGSESRVTLELSGVQAQPLVEALTSVRDVFAGSLNGTMSLTSRGLDWDAISKTARGEGRLSVADADLRTVQLLPEVARALTAIGRIAGFQVPASLESTKFSGLETSLRLADGRLSTPDLTLSGRDVAVSADGWLGLDRSLSYEGNVILQPALVKSLGNAGRYIADPQGRLALPFRVSGQVAAPKVAIDERVVLDLGRRVLARQAGEKIGGTAGKVLGDVLGGGGGKKADPVDLLRQLLKPPAPTPTPR